MSYAAAAPRGMLARWGFPVAAGVVTAYLAFYLVLRPHPGYPRSMDYTSWLATAQTVLDGRAGEMYDLSTQIEYQRAITWPFETPGGALVYNRAPFFVLPFLPLARLPFELSYAIWVATILVEGVLALWLIAAYVYPATWPATPSWFKWTLAAFAFFPVFQGTLLGQTALLELLAVTAFYLLYIRGREGAAGVVLGLIGYKPHVVAFFAAALLMRRAWRALAGIALVAAAYAALSLILVGPAGVYGFFRISDQVSHWNCIYGVYPELHQSWRGLLVGWLVPPCTGPNPEVTTVPALGQADQVALVLDVVTVAVMLAAWWRWRKTPAGSAHFDLLIAATCLAAQLASPYSNPQDLTRLVLVAALLWRAQRSAPGILPAAVSVPALVVIGIVLGPLAMTTLARPVHPLVWFVAAVYGVVIFSLFRPAQLTSDPRPVAAG